MTVRVNPHVPGPMETRNKHASQEVCQSQGLPEKQAAGSATPKSFWPATKSMKPVQRGNMGDNVTNMIKIYNL